MSLANTVSSQTLEVINLLDTDLAPFLPLDYFPFGDASVNIKTKKCPCFTEECGPYYKMSYHIPSAIQTLGFIFFTIVNNTFIFLAGLVYVGCRPRDFLKHAIWWHEQRMGV